MKEITCILSACIILLACNGVKTGAYEDYEFKYIPLEEYKYTPSDIKDPSAVTLLSFSGGPGCNEDAVFYLQFIAVVDSTKDTVRIFCPCQEYPDVMPEKATFINTVGPGSLDNFVQNDIGAGKMKYVVFNKKNAAIEEGNYKTVFGMLGF